MSQIKNKATLIRAEPWGLFLFSSPAPMGVLLECSLYGTDGDAESIVKLIAMKEDRFRRVSVEETEYKQDASRVIVAEETVSLETDSDGSAAEASPDEDAGRGVRRYIRVYSPPDKSKQRKVIARGLAASRIRRYDPGAMERYVDALLLAPVAKRRYSMSVYRYRGADVQIVESESNERNLVVVKYYTSNVLEGEQVLEEIKSKLGKWVDLAMPPAQAWSLLI